MMMKNYWKHIPIVLFVIAAAVLLPVRNSELLYAIEEHNLFVPRASFLAVENINWLECAASYLTQFFYYPWLGSAMVILMWVAIYYLTCSALRLRNLWTVIALIPPVVLLLSYLCVGYWIYYLHQPGYFCLPTLISLLLCALLATIRFAVRRMEKKYVTDAVFATILVLALALVFRPLHFTRPQKTFFAELGMHHSLEDLRYEDVIREYEDFDGEPTNLMVMYKNLALLNTGRITEMFSTGNCGKVPEFPEGLNISMNRIAGPLIYLQLGQVNFAQRCAMENSVLHGFDLENVKTLSYCSLLNKEFDASHKYLYILRHSLFHHSYTREHTQMLTNFNPLFESMQYKVMEAVHDPASNFLDTDNNHCHSYIMDYYSGLISANPYLEDFIICSSLWSKAKEDFIFHLYYYMKRHSRGVLPLAYQQAAVMFGSEEDAPQELRNLPLDEVTVIAPYQDFATQVNELNSRGLSMEEIGRELAPRFGKTYWWYYYFYTDFQIY